MGFMPNHKTHIKDERHGSKEITLNLSRPLIKAQGFLSSQPLANKGEYPWRCFPVVPRAEEI